MYMSDVWVNQIAVHLTETHPNSPQYSESPIYSFADKGPSSQSYGFSSSHVWMWEFDHKESWAPKIDVFDLWCWRRLLSPLDCKEIKPVKPNGN